MVIQGRQGILIFFIYHWERIASIIMNVNNNPLQTASKWIMFLAMWVIHNLLFGNGGGGSRGMNQTLSMA